MGRIKFIKPLIVQGTSASRINLAFFMLVNVWDFLSGYVIIKSLPFSNLVTGRRCADMSPLVSFIASIVAGVIANYIFKKLTDNDDND